MTPYWQKLKDPRWQRLRLEVMSEHDFSCENCGDRKSTLNVHHKQYFKGREPWEYEPKQLACLCEACHEEHHLQDDPLSVATSFLPMDGPYSRSSLAALIVGFSGQEWSDDCADPYDYFTGIFARSIFSGDVTVGCVRDLAEFSERDSLGLVKVMVEYVKSKHNFDGVSNA